MGNFAVKGNGSSGTITIPSNSFDGLAAGTIEFFLNSETTDGNFHKLMKKDSAIDIGINNDGKVFGEIPGVGNLGVIGDAINDGEDHHIAFSWDGSWLRGYVDGVYKGRTAQGGSQNSNSNNLYLLSTGGGEYYGDVMEEFRLSNTARYTTETSFTPPAEEFSSDANTLILLHFNEGVGTNAEDSSSNSNDGTLNGGVSWVTGFFLPKMETLQDDFDFGGVDVTKWNNWGGSQIVADTDLVLKLSSILGGSYAGLETLSTFNLTGSSAFIQLLDAGNQSIPSWEVYPVLVHMDSDNEIFIRITGGNVQVRKKVATVLADVGSSVPYNSSTMKWFRIRESGGTIYFEYATTPTGSWTEIANVASPFAVTALRFQPMIGTWQTEASTTTAIIDNINVLPDELQFEWSGYIWNKRIHQGDPAGWNVYSKDNVSDPDEDDYLTLSLTNALGNSPIGAEIFSDVRGWGYGTYLCVIATRLDNIDAAAAFGNMFTFDFTTPPDWKEIDMGEIRHYNSNPNKRILKSHVWNNEGSREFITDDMDMPAYTIHTHRAIWLPDKITFDSYEGEGILGTNFSHAEHTTHLPSPNLERVHFNLWVDKSIMGYNNVSPLDVVMRSFSFTPLAGGNGLRTFGDEGLVS